MHRTRHARHARHTRRARHTMHRSRSRRTTSSSRHRSRSTNSDCPSRRSRRAQKHSDPAAGAAVHKKYDRPTSSSRQAHSTPDPAAEAVMSAMPPIARGKRILTGSKTPGKTLQIRRKRGENCPTCKRRDSRRRFRNPRRLRGKRLNTLLGFTSGQPSWLHRSQAGRSQVSPA